MDSSDQDPVAIVTGASRGIGRGVARQLADAGFSVVVGYATDEAGAWATVDQIRTGGGRAEPIRVDVRDRLGIADLFRVTTEILGPVRVLVNNAGTNHPPKRFEEVEHGQWADVVATNLLGTYWCSAEMVRRPAGGDRLIVNISSPAAFYGTRVGAAYAASKAGVAGLTRAMARSLAGRGIRVNCVVPGSIPTGLRTQTMDHRVEEEIRAATPLKMEGSPDEIGRVVSYLSSPSSRAINGQFIFVDGGRMMF